MMVFINTLKSDDIYYKDLVTLDSKDDCLSGSRNVSQHARTGFLKTTLTRTITPNK